MENFDVVVIGGGPGGYVAAIRCAQLGLSTACVDDWTNKDGGPSLGGTCLNVGCIPSKALLDSSHQYAHLQELTHHGIDVTGVTLDLGRMLARKDQIVTKLTGGIAFLFKKNKITGVHGRGQLVRRDGDRWVIAVGDRELAATHVILATGSVPRPLPLAPFDNDRVVDNAGALAFPEVPKRLGVIGAGVIGLELGSVWRRLGAEVTILEALPDFLGAADQALAKEAAKQFKAQGLAINLGVKIEKVETVGNEVTVHYNAADGTAHQATFDRLIVAIGRVPNTNGLGADAVGLALTDRGFIQADHLKTNLPNVWAIGDVIGGAMLAHKAEDEGVAVAELIAGQAGHVNYDVIPWVIYTSPELAWVGPSEQTLRERGTAINVGTFSFAANARAMAHGDTRGFVKVIADAGTDRLLAVHMVGPGVSELVGEVVTLMEFAGSAEDLGRLMHAHPTLSEVVKEAALAAGRRAIHA